ncbi:MAG TPA: DUF5818 domain-containing protein [Terriglobia bacterium]|nr:DUF5818 domain-containing protein [Terriglobia bacterium]
MKNKILTALTMAAAFGLVQFGAGTASAAQQGQYNQQQGQQYPGTEPRQQPPSKTPQMHGPSSSRTEQFFIGTIQKKNGKYVLSSAGQTYKLDQQSAAKNFKNQRVQVKGTLAMNGNTIHVQQIAPLKNS